jgi:aminobenzoyl-glutamate utilization protein B
VKKLSSLIVLLLAFFFNRFLEATSWKQEAIVFLEQHQSEFSRLARDIWEQAELGYQEERSMELSVAALETAGFRVETGVAEIPTAFVASYGRGNPVIGFLAEYDALPGMSQVTESEPRPLVEGAPGHACGHNLLGVASIAAALAVKDWLDESGGSGTVRVYGTPAEEGGAGKVYMVRAGLFNDVDAVLAWHPGDNNNARPQRCLANRSAKFRFYKVAGEPDAIPLRTSALDGVEAMSHLVNLMTKHLTPTSRIQYIVSDGGYAPNVAPDTAEIYYYCRHAEVEMVRHNWDRIVKASEAAALGTSTRVEHEVIHGLYPLLPNETLSKVVDASLRQVGGVTYSAEELEFAKEIRKTFSTSKPLGAQEEVEPYGPGRLGTYSTDVGDISWQVPTAQFTAATWVPGTPGHSWQVVAQGGMSIGYKGMMVAAKTMATASIDLLMKPEIVEAARREHEEARGPDFHYEPLLGDRKPPLDFRK